MTVVGQHVAREDGTVWQVEGISLSHRRHRAGHTVSPVATTTYRLARKGVTVDVEVWGSGAAQSIGAVSEVLTPVRAQLGGAA